MNLQTILLFITATVNSILSLLVLFGKRDKINIIYSIFVVFASMWAIGLGYFLLNDSFTTSLYLANFYYISAAGIPAFFLYFSYIFLNKNTNKLVEYLIILPFLLITILFLDKNFLISAVYDAGWGKDVVINVCNYLIYAGYFFVMVILSYYSLISSYLHNDNAEEKNQLKFIILGTSVGFIFGMIFNLILPYLGNYKYIYLGPLFSFSMVASIGYSITRHHLFNMKVVITEVLMFLLWVFILVRTYLSDTFQDQLANSILFIVTVVVGVFLIRSVLREVALRENIEKLADDLQTANQGQVNLIHVMNHQVKGHLGNAKNIFAELLTDDYGVMPDDARPLLEKGLQEANLGVEYVQNILRGASAVTGTLPFDMKPINFREIVEAVFEKQKGYAESKGLSITLDIKDGDYGITGDGIQLPEAVKNLIDNSINYTEKGIIQVSLSVSDKVSLVVKDTGVGISDEDKPKLFKSGGRGTDSLKININSTGYGLAFVKGVVEAHKGRVWAESDGPGKGSVFYMELPRS
jgi:signal transduction histidine kinase